YLAGDFNDWQCPGHPAPNPARFLPMELHRGYGGRPNLWLRRVPEASPGQEYAFFVQGGVAVDGDLPPERYQVDPYARVYGRDRGRYNAAIVDPSGYAWGDAGWRTPDPRDLIIYEMSVYGFTQGAPGVPGAEQGTFAGVARQIERGYFRDLGVTALAFMPTSEAPSFQGPRALGYDPCGFMTVERDFGTPDDLRRLVDTAHRHGLAVIMDAVFNHTANTFNPLWGAIDDGTPGGFYFSGGTPWGNRVATEKPEVQNMLIDACKLFLHEYHVDGFRFDATHSSWMDHGFLRRLASEIKDRGFKPDCLLIAENLPNEADLNLEGYNGFAQWCDPFHDKLKALLREGIYQDWVRDDPEHLGRIFYFCRDFYAAHTNNVVNFVESHDENSVPFEAATNPAAAAGPLDRSRKARLGLFAVLTALGQPMLYMGQEFGVDRPRNLVIFDWPGNPEEDPFHAWTRKLIHLRRSHPALRISGYNPAAEGKFTWLVGPWLDAARGGGRKAIGWRAEAADGDGAAVLINFSREPIRADLDLGEGRWRLAADLERAGEEGWAEYEVAGRLEGFEIPPESGLLWLRA
ncbi:MAG: alpha-amylase family glycosyl hydrolase, partial [Bacteroidota bacterium]